MIKACDWAAALRLALAGLVLSTGIGHADIVFGTKSEPTIDLDAARDTGAAEPAAWLERADATPAALLGSTAPEIAAQRGNLLSAILAVPQAPAGRAPDYTRAGVDALAAATGDAEWECLTEALYFEARGEDAKGVFAVAEVILNRVDSGRFPSTVCKVVNQGTGEKWKCQFSYTCDGIPDVVREKAAWERMGKIARIMLDGGERTLTGGATFYHTKAVNPSWASVFDRTTTIGFHHFYAQT
ncbi:cell wall hydrolase [Palleronia sediminis]|uniref:Cell wall hydrolase n=1 Tax=Palleronia sediminis TaxID=2547833 RepID=A0A4R6A9W9_9RHOB|nr:cell wall hydrolase [Palleronia sediminis]TDL79797.1 cell wall hydrolase [Palleronia sediminis]